MSSEKKIKVCRVAASDLTLRFLVFEEMKYLCSLGYEVWAVSSPGKWVQDIQEAGIHVKTIPITRKMFTPMADLRAFLQLVIFFREQKFDIVHTHTPKANFLGQIASFIARVPIRICTIHGLYFQRRSSLKKRALFVPIEKITSFIVHRAFSLNREDVKILTEWGIYPKEKMVYLGAGINLDRFNPEKYKGDFLRKKKAQLDIPPDAPVVGIVARLVKEKGYIPLFRAFAKVLEEFPRAVLLVIGPEEPEKKDRLDSSAVKAYGIAPQSIFLGERSDVEELYPLMDVFVLPSFREGLGRSILEAGAMRKPAVASDIRGCKEAIDHGKTGLLVPSNSSEKLAKALIYMLSHPEEARAMGEAAREKVEREFNYVEVLKKLEHEYAQLLERKFL
jgi:glycosyltransferase involved in cell wall biosynthesis